MTPTPITARSTALISCHSCHLLCRPRTLSGSRRMQCPRCGASLHQRKPRSLTRTWALLMAAAICYIPANVLPATRAISFGKVQTDTIMSGVIYFIKSGMWPIALVIFVASICVPLCEAAHPLLSVDFCAPPFILAPQRAHPFLPTHGGGRSLVDGRYLCHHDLGRPGQARCSSQI